MVEFATLAAFIPAVLVLIVAPGPDTIYAVTQSLKSGRSAGFIAALGTATGVVVHTAAAILGLAALLRTSALAYTVVKYVGAAYLLYLGVKMIRSDDRFELQSDLTEQDDSLAESYRKAVVINVSNPKVAVFVLAFFPQFVPASANAPFQMSVLGLLYAGLSVLYLGAIALFAGQVRHHLLHSNVTRRAIQYVSGSVLVGFGMKLALEKRPAV